MALHFSLATLQALANIYSTDKFHLEIKLAAQKDEMIFLGLLRINEHSFYTLDKIKGQIYSNFSKEQWIQVIENQIFDSKEKLKELVANQIRLFQGWIDAN